MSASRENGESTVLKIVTKTALIAMEIIYATNCLVNAYLDVINLTLETCVTRSVAQCARARIVRILPMIARKGVLQVILVCLLA